MTYKWLKTDLQGTTEIITLNDPATLNALNDEMRAEFAQELERAEGDPSVRVLIITGEGRGFCSGANVKEMAVLGRTAEPENVGARDQFYTQRLGTPRMVYGLRHISKPAIAAINGSVAGSGVGLAAACDVRIASERMKMVWSFLQRGTMPEDASFWLLTHLVGYSSTFLMATTPRPVDAQRALQTGFVSQVVPSDQLLPTCLALAREIAESCPPITTQLFKMALVQSLHRTQEEAMFIVDKAQKIARATADHTEAIRAFVEKRKPVWKGR